MAISTTSCIAGALVLIIASGFVLTSGQSTKDSQLTCANFSSSCYECLNVTSHANLTCQYFITHVESNTTLCGNDPPQVAEQNNVVTKLEDCSKPIPPIDPKTTTTEKPTTSTIPTTTSPTTPTTTAPSTTTPSTTVPTTTPPNSTSTTTVPTTHSPNITTTTASPPTTAAPPHGGGMSWASFFGGIVFTAAVSSVAYLVWRFYKARQERNYHTLTTNLI